MEQSQKAFLTNLKRNIMEGFYSTSVCATPSIPINSTPESVFLNLSPYTAISFSSDNSMNSIPFANCMSNADSQGSGLLPGTMQTQSALECSETVTDTSVPLQLSFSGSPPTPPSPLSSASPVNSLNSTASQISAKSAKSTKSAKSAHSAHSAPSASSASSSPSVPSEFSSTISSTPTSIMGSVHPQSTFLAVPSPSPSTFYPQLHSSTIFTATPINVSNAFKEARVLIPGLQPITHSSHPTPPSLTTCQFGCCVDTCAFVCDTADSMRDHFKQHPTKRWFRCLFPGCSFTSCVLKDLTYHKGIHTGERPFACHFINCGFAAPTLAQLRLHMISHSKEKPYKCSYNNCNYSSRYKSALLNHERTHTGEKPYKCKYCKVFSAKQKSGLQYHIRTVHGRS